MVPRYLKRNDFFRCSSISTIGVQRRGLEVRRSRFEMFTRDMKYGTTLFERLAWMANTFFLFTRAHD